MSYEPLHHKYRPQTFTDLVGQEAIATTLINAIRTQRIAPAYLFTGSRGTGKTSSARILAKSLNCLKNNVPTENPCGQCDVCQGITKGATLDVIEIDAASNTGVDNIRELIERSQFAPVQCRYKVYVIDECHMLSTAAFNALLKTLEEPPNRVVFILATTDPQRVLPTIISRCQRFDFRRIPLDSMVKHLRYIALQENININDEAITLVAQVAQGGLRDAESLLDQLSLLTEPVTVDRVWDLVGAVPERDLLELLDAIINNNAESVLDKARKLMDRGREPLIVLQNLAGFYRDLLIAKSAPNRNDLVAMTTPTWNQLCVVSKTIDTNLILRGQKHLKDSEVQIKNTTQPRLWLEVTLLGLLPSANIIQPSEVRSSNVSENRVNTEKQQPEARKNESSNQHLSARSSTSSMETNNNVYKAPITPQVEASKPLPTNIVPPKSVPIPLVVNSNNLEQIWHQILANLSIPVKALLSQHGKLLAIHNQEVRIGIRTESLLKMAHGKVADVENAFLQIFNQKVKVNLQVGINSESQVTSPQSQFIPPTITETPIHNLEVISSPDLAKINLSLPKIELDTFAIATNQLVQFFKGEIVNINDIKISKILPETADQIEDDGIEF